MFLIVGLGNPGAQYDETRHNVGFMFVDKLAASCGSQITQSKFKSLTARIKWNGNDILVMKPQTFMNRSGQAVNEASTFFKIPTNQIVVVCDDLDQAHAAVRCRTGGGHGGHNGLRDMLLHLPDEGFHRIKIGIGKPEFKSDTADWVLNRFSAEQETSLQAESFPTVEKRLMGLIHQNK